jgi:hypothetical protein
MEYELIRAVIAENAIVSNLSFETKSVPSIVVTNSMIVWMSQNSKAAFRFRFARQ